MAGISFTLYYYRYLATSLEIGSIPTAKKSKIINESCSHSLSDELLTVLLHLLVTYPLTIGTRLTLSFLTGWTMAGVKKGHICYFWVTELLCLCLSCYTYKTDNVILAPCF